LDNQQTPERPRGVTPAPGAETKAGPWTFLILALAIVGGLYYLSVEFGPHVPWQIGKAAIGLGLVIFLHELGHFAVAKWCDVHVEAFSLGFGPAIPGLSFRKGETLYKIAWIPLGGYVKMVGEGSENEEDDTDPRSFKNKTVGQRMAIISAGVVMNVILGCVCFILAYQGGVKQSPAVVGLVEPGSPAWKHDVRSGQVIYHIGGDDHPYFEDLLFSVMLSREGQELRMVVARPGDDPRELYITPRRDANDSKPVIGMAPPQTPQLFTKHFTRGKVPPTNGLARAARALALQRGDVVVAASDPNDPERMAALPPRKEGSAERTDYDALCKRFLEFTGAPLAVEVRRPDGRTEKVELSACGFEYGDLIVGTTDPGQTGLYDPYQTSPLPDDPEVRNPEGGHPDYFVFSERMQRLAGKPVILEVRRHGEKEGAAPVAVLVPPAFHRVIPGLRMMMGKVKAVRGGSSAETAGVQPGDRILGVELTDGKQVFRVVSKLSQEKLPDNVKEKPLDPVRLPFDLRQWAAGRSNLRATLRVSRDKQHEDSAPQALEPVPWDETRRFDREAPLALAAPTSIPELGVAYQVETLVDKVEAGSPAAAKLREGDVVLAVAFKDVNYEKGEKWTSELELYQKKNEPQPWWAHVAWNYQDPDAKAIKMKVLRGKDEEEEIELDLASDPTWPLAERGLRLMPDQRLQKADGPLQAVGIGVTRTYQMIVKTYMSLRSMITGRVSAVKNLRGPISIAEAAFDIAGEGFSQFMFFLAIISVNLAVINFLPIPVLDGGHMVFLIYEKLRGRPATEQVRLALTYVGLLLILSLMAFVIYLDVKRKLSSG
jgi:membrane-associated protease RseP (regulator of RpoE activity)